MSLDTYDNLKAEVADWLNRSDLTSQIVSFITLTETQMARDFARIGVRPSVARATLTITTGTVSVPTDFAGAKSLRLSGGNELTWISPQEMASRKAYSTEIGEPRDYSIVGGQFEFNPEPNGTYSGLLVYEQRPAALSDAAPTNWVLTNHPDLYLNGALAQAMLFLNDAAQLAKYAALYKAGIDDLEAATMAESVGGRLTPQNAFGNRAPV